MSNRLALIRWPGGSGGSGTGGTSVGAANGVSVQAGLVVLGQLVNQAGGPGKLLSPRELPFNGQSILFSGISSTPGSHLIFKNSGANPLDPTLEFQSNAGVQNGLIRFDDGGSTYIGGGAGLTATGTINTGFGFQTLGSLTTGDGNVAVGWQSLLNVTTGRQNTAIGAAAGRSANARGNVFVGIVTGDLSDGGTIGEFNTILGSESGSLTTGGSIGSGNVIIGSFSVGGVSVLGNDNIVIGNSSFVSSGFTNSIYIVSNPSGILTVSNVAVLGDDRHNVLIGQNGFVLADTGQRLQVSGGIKLTSLPVTNNPKLIVGWDTITNQLVSASGATVVFTADNGLTGNVPTANNVELGGSLIKNTTISTGAFQLNISGAFAGGGSVFNAANSVGPGAIITGTSTTNAGLVAINTSTGPGMTATTNGGAAFNGQTTDNVNTNTVLPVLQLRRQTAIGTAGSGIGGSIEFYNATVGSSLLSNSIISKWTNPTDAVRTSQLSLTGISSGTTKVLITFDGIGTGTMSNAVPNGNLLFVNNTEATVNNVAIKGQSINGAGISGVSTGNDAVNGVSTNGFGGNFQSTNSVGLNAVSGSGSGAAALFATLNAPTGNDVQTVAGFVRNTTGSAANGIGARIVLFSKTTGSQTNGNTLISTLTDATTATVTSQFSITGVNLGATNVLLTISGAGIFTLTQGLGNFLNDTAAAIGGVPVNGLYRNGSIVQIRVT